MSAASLTAAELTGGPVDRARVLAIGDGLATDIAGANRQGLDVLFIGGGIHGSSAVMAGRQARRGGDPRGAGRFGRLGTLRHGRSALERSGQARRAG